MCFIVFNYKNLFIFALQKERDDNGEVAQTVRASDS